MNNKEIPLGEIKILWKNLSKETREAIFAFDAGKVAFFLIKDAKGISVDDACDYANVIIKIYKNQLGFSDEIH